MTNQFDITAFNRTQYARPDWAADYLDAFLQPAEAMILVKYREELAQRRILELECGGGRLSRYLARLTTSAIGMAFLPGFVERCRQSIPGMGFVQGDVRDLSKFANESFDVVFFMLN